MTGGAFPTAHRRKRATRKAHEVTEPLSMLFIVTSEEPVLADGDGSLDVAVRLLYRACDAVPGLMDGPRATTFARDV
jgi:hypothetical protein